jgi:hypothetical protein
MILTDVLALLHTSSARMAEAYGEPVFDEWVIVRFDRGRGEIVHYQGPRPEAFVRTFARDAVPLGAETAGKHYSAGDFEFAREAAGTSYDALVALAPRVYLLANHTQRTMAEIRGNPLWLRAQVPFAALCERFRADPMALG